MKSKILIATHNRGKFEDLLIYIQNLPYEFVSLSDLNISEDIEETGSTFEENAILKARFFAKVSGLPTIADDSGIEVDALNGEPGIYSARYAGENATDEERVSFLLKKMENVLADQRQASFTTVIAFAQNSKIVSTFEGKCSGILTKQPVGPLISGLPYCCLLYLPEYGKSIAELKITGTKYPSQRAQALEKLSYYLKKCSGQVKVDTF